MASIFEIFGTQRKQVIFLTEGTEDTPDKELIRVDATLSETHTTTATPTDHPVEEGSNITDNVDVLPAELSIDGVISDSPITIKAAIIGNVAGLAGGAVGGIAGAAVTTGVAALAGEIFNTAPNRAETSYNILLDAQRRALPVSIITGLRTYTNMIITNIQVNRNAQIGRSLSFTASLKEVRLVQSETFFVSQQKIEKAIASSAAKKQNVGQTPTSEADDATNDTFLLSITKPLFGLFR